MMYHPSHYCGYVLGPDGNNIEAVCHKAAISHDNPSTAGRRRCGQRGPSRPSVRTLLCARNPPTSTAIVFAFGAASKVAVASATQEAQGMDGRAYHAATAATPVAGVGAAALHATQEH